MNKKIKRCMRKIIAAAMVLTLTAGIMPVQPIAEMFSSPAIIVKAAEGTESEIGYTLDENGLLTLKAGTYTDPTFSNDLNIPDVKSVVAEDGVVLKGSCSGLFWSWSAESIDLSNVNTSEVTDMSNMFRYCSSLVSLNLNGIDTSSVENMSEMFYNCGAIESIDLSSFDTSKVTNMSSMFERYSYHTYAGELTPTSSLRNIIFGDKFTTANVTDMNRMFYGNTKLKELDLSGFDRTKTEQIESFFGRWVTHLSKITLSDKMYIDEDCGLINITTDYMGNAGWFVSGDSEKTLISGEESYAVLPAASAGTTVTYEAKKNDEDITYTFEDGTLTIHTGEFGDNNNTLKAAITNITGDILSVKKLVLESGVKLSGYYSYGLQSFENLEEADLSQADMTEVISLSNFFSICKSLKTVKLGKTSNKLSTVDYLLGSSSYKLESADLSLLDTSGVTSMAYMFYGCSSLKSLDLSNIDTSSVTNMNYMFYGCSSLKNIDLSACNLKRVTNMNGMFSGCKALESITFSDAADSTSITSCTEMFRDCTNLKTLDLSNLFFNSGVSNSNMFSNADIRTLTIPASLNITTSASLHNTGVSADRTVTFNGWKKDGQGDVISGSATNATISGAGTYIMDATDKGISYELNGTTLTLKSGTYGRTGNEYYYDIASIVQYLNNVNSTTIKKIVVEANVVFDEIGNTFNNCEGVEEIDLSAKDLSKMKNMSYMFAYCYDLKNVIFMPGEKINSVTNMGSMFFACHELEEIDLSPFDTSNVTSFYEMFENCEKLKSLDLSNFVFSENASLSGMFTLETSSSGYGRYATILDSLTELKLPASANITESVKLRNSYISDDKIFLGWKNKTTGEVVAGYGDYAVFNCAETGAGTYIREPEVFDYSFSNNTLTINAGSYSAAVFKKIAAKAVPSSSNLKKVVVKDGVKFIGNCDNMFEREYYSTGLEVVFDGTIDTSEMTSMQYMFSRCIGEELDLSNFDTSKITDMYCLFYGTSIDKVILGGKFTTSNVTDMGYMFYGSNIPSLDFTQIDTGSATNMSSMFQGCKAVHNYDLSGLDTSEATSVSQIFAGSSIESVDMSILNTKTPMTSLSKFFENCTELKTVTFGTFNSSAVTNISYMFSGCKSLENVDLSGLNSTIITTVNSLFKDCTSMESIDISGLKTTKVNDASYLFSGCTSLKNVVLSDTMSNDASYLYIGSMFLGCNSLTEIDMAPLEGFKVTSIASAFQNCTSLKTIKNLEKVNTATASYANLFSGCSSLEDVDLSGITINTSGAWSNTPGLQNMFYNCSKLKEIDLSNIKLNNVYMQNMFKGCSSVEKIILGDPADNVTITTTSSNYTDMFEGTDMLTELRVPKTFYISSYYKLPNTDLFHTGWYKESDESKTVVSGTSEYATIPMNSTESFTYKRDTIDVSNNKVLNASLTLEGQIGLNFYAVFPESVVNNEKAYVLLSGPSGKEKVKISDAVYDKNNGYKFTYKLAAKQINQEVTVSVYDGDSNTPLTLVNSKDEAAENNTFGYSVMDYIDYVKANVSDTKLVDLVSSLEIYGSYAQKYFNYNTDSINETNFNSDILELVNNVTTDDFQDYKYEQDTSLPDDIRFTGYSLVLQSTTKFKLYFECDDMSKYRFTSDGSDPIHIDGNKYYIEISDIPAKYINSSYSIDINDSETGDYLSQIFASPLSYAYSALKQRGSSDKQSDIDLCNTMKALYIYNQKAKTYFN